MLAWRRQKEQEEIRSGQMAADVRWRNNRRFVAAIDASSYRAEEYPASLSPQTSHCFIPPADL